MSFFALFFLILGPTFLIPAAGPALEDKIERFIIGFILMMGPALLFQIVMTQQKQIDQLKADLEKKNAAPSQS